MQVEQVLKEPHEQRLAEVRRLVGAARPPTISTPDHQAADAEERLRVAMVRLLPRATRSDDACAHLLTSLADLRSFASSDVRALDAWHNAYEVAIDRSLDPERSEFRTFLAQYSALLEMWLARSS